MQGVRELWADAWKALRPYTQVPFPAWLPVRQRLPMPTLTSVDDAVRRELAKEEVRRAIRPGMKVALAVGSRGVANISLLVRRVVDAVRALGGDPFIVPAMGSHGAATAAGQAEYLAGLGVDERTTGAPVRATMDVIALGRTKDGSQVYLDRFAAEADAIIPICRIKPHTSFHGPVESGAAKMLAIGLGKQKGAASLHARGFTGFSERIQEAARIVAQARYVPFALCTVENARSQTAHVEAVPGERLAAREPELLNLARSLMGRLLVDAVDVLIVGRIGKDISGMGMDPNVIGRYTVPGMSGGVRASKLAVLDVTEGSHGNSLGIGLADIVTARVLERTDLAALYINVVTSTVFTGARIPVCVESDRDAVGLALATCNGPHPPKARLAFIESTKALERIYVSEALWQAHRDEGIFEPLGPPEPMPFTGDGRLLWR